MNEIDSQILISASVGLALYVLTFWATLGVFIWWASKRAELCPGITVERVFFFFLLLFLALRSFWVVLRLFADYGTAEFAVNRIAGLCFLTVFTSILFAWVEEIHSGTFSASEGYTKFLTNAARAYLLLNLAIWAFQVAVIAVLFPLSPLQRAQSRLLLANTLAMVSFYLLLALAFLLYGARLYQLRSGNDIDSISKTRTQLRRILLATVGFGLCFALRVVVFLLDSLGPAPLPPNLFMALGYLLPEIVPCWIALVIALGYGRNPDALDFIDTLYGDDRVTRLHQARRSLGDLAPPDLHHKQPFLDRLQLNYGSTSPAALVHSGELQHSEAPPAADAQGQSQRRHYRRVDRLEEQDATDESCESDNPHEPSAIGNAPLHESDISSRSIMSERSEPFLDHLPLQLSPRTEPFLDSIPLQLSPQNSPHLSPSLSLSFNDHYPRLSDALGGYQHDLSTYSLPSYGAYAPTQYPQDSALPLSLLERLSLDLNKKR